MRFSSRRWAGIIASLVYFFLIITQIPLFRFPCRIGICQTPVEITVCQLIASEIFPQVVVKALLYTGAIREYFVQGTSLDRLLSSFKSDMLELPPTTDLKHLEVLAGSYLCVAGALLGLIKRGRMSMFGSRLIIWGITREIFMQKQATDPDESVCIYPTLMLALVLAVCSVRREVRKFIRSCISRGSGSQQLKVQVQMSLCCKNFCSSLLISLFQSRFRY